MYVAIDILIMCKSEGGEPKSDNHQWNVFSRKARAAASRDCGNDIPYKRFRMGRYPSTYLPKRVVRSSKEICPPPVEKIKNGEDILKRASNAPKFPSVKQKSTTYLGIGDSLPDFMLYDIKGRQWSNKDLKGKKVVINFWFTGCAPV